jgi:hypothetical protein
LSVLLKIKRKKKESTIRYPYIRLGAPYAFNKTLFTYQKKRYPYIRFFWALKIKMIDSKTNKLSTYWWYEKKRTKKKEKKNGNRLLQSLGSFL